MLKKIIAIVIAIGLLEQNMLFAQSSSKELPLATAQKQAKVALASINVGGHQIDQQDLFYLALTFGFGVSIGIAYANLLTDDTMAIRQKGSEKGLEQGYVEGMEEVRQDGYLVGLRRWRNFQYILQQLKEEHPAAYAHLKQAMDPTLDKLPPLSEQEIRQVLKDVGISEAKINHIIKSSAHTDLFFSIKRVLYPLVTTPGEKTIQVTHWLLKRWGLVGVGLLLLTTTAAQAQDNSIVNRIVKDPNLFLNADQKGLQAIEQDPLAADYCRELAKGLQELAAMPAAKRQEVLDQVQQQGQKHAAKRVERAVSSITAR